MKKKAHKDKKILINIFKKLKITDPFNKKIFNINLIATGRIDSLQTMILHTLLEKNLSIKILDFDKEVGDYKISNIFKFIKKRLKN
tara:strand:+ start:381 stop:638 length:258 start_codon:yes stop_codon:yes gene_type:complete